MNETWYLDEPAFGETNRLMSKISTMIIGCSVGEVQAKRKIVKLNESSVNL